MSPDERKALYALIDDLAFESMIEYASSEGWAFNGEEWKDFKFHLCNMIDQIKKAKE
jgi:hypothetical protein